MLIGELGQGPGPRVCTSVAPQVAQHKGHSLCSPSSCKKHGGSHLSVGIAKPLQVRLGGFVQEEPSEWAPLSPCQTECSGEQFGSNLDSWLFSQTC